MLLNKLKGILKKYFRILSDFIYISKKIEEDEIIIRILISPKHYSLDKNEFEDRKLKDFFLQNKGGVSVNRYRFLKENAIKQSAFKIKGEQNYIGFAIFNIKIFKNSILEYRIKFQNENLTPTIISSPLDSNNEIITTSYIFTFQRGNLSHADIVYIENDLTIELPCTSIRNFSRILAKNCLKVVDKDLENPKWVGEKFNSVNLI